MHPGWSPHGGMRAASCGTLLMAWELHHAEFSYRHEGSKSEIITITTETTTITTKTKTTTHSTTKNNNNKSQLLMT